MNHHRLVGAIEKALCWDGPSELGDTFARGKLADRDLCGRLMTPTRLLDLIMRRSLSAARISCLQDGDYVHPQTYLTTKAMRRAEAVQMVDMERLGILLKEGCTLVLDGVNAYDATLEVACRALQWWSRELVQVNAYLTTGSAAGFQMHWDDHDVVIVQVAGEKSWEVRGLSRPVPMYRDAVPNPTPTDEIVWKGTLQTGEVMHIPRGYWHQATRQQRGDGFSLHLTFGFPKRTGVDYFTWIADESRQAELMRHDVDRWGTVGARKEQQLAFTDMAVRLAATHSLDGFLAAREDQSSSARHVITHGLFGMPLSVVCMTEFPPRIEQDGDRIVVAAATRRITFAAKALPAVELLTCGRPVFVDKVGAATGLDAMTIAETLIREGICAEVTPELAAGYDSLLTPEAP
jgi:hypothetical protein